MKSEYPGVSNKLTFVFFHVKCSGEAAIEICLSISFGLKSEVVLPSAIVPILFISPAEYNKNSEIVVLPLPP